MAYIGNNAVTQQFVPGADRFSGDGSTTAFTLSRPVGSVFDIQVSVDNVIQDPYTAYGVNGQTLTFTGAPLVGSFNIQVVYRSLVTQTIKPGAGTITTEAFSNQAINNVAIGSTTASTGRFTDLTDTGLTATRITYAGTGGNLVDSANLTFNGTTLTAAALTVSGATALNGGTTLGDASGDALTINSSAVSIPNGLNFDSNTFVIDATNNNIGIGTASPTAALSVRASFDFWSEVAGTNKFAMFGGGAGLLYAGTTTATDLALITNGSEKMRITSAGNVGIGTSSPVGKLHINESTNANLTQRIENPNAGSSAYANLQLRNDATNTCELGIQSSTRSTTYPVNEGWLYASVGLNLGFAGATKFYSGSAERMRLDSSGNLGLGVIPSAWGSIVKPIEFSNSAYIGGQTNSTPAFYAGANAFYNGTNWIYKTTNPATNYITSTGQHQWFNAPSGTAGNAITFTQAMTLDASGNLGIGTTSPDAGFQLTAFAPTTAAIRIRGGATGSDSARTASLSLLSAGHEEWIVRGASDSMRFLQSSTERMRITNTGNVGIGTNSPTLARLQVNQTSNTSGAIYAVAASGQNGDAYVFAISGVTNGYQITNNGSNNIQHIWSGTGGSERMRIDSSGNVGIGTSSPNERLTVLGNINLPSGANRFVRIGSGSNYSYDVMTATDDFQIREAELDSKIRLRIKYSSTPSLAGQLQLPIEGSSTLYNSYTCRAWVNFNGSGGGIRASGNVSSISQRASGCYSFNFSTAMPDANYSVQVTTSATQSVSWGGVPQLYHDAPDSQTAPTASSFIFLTSPGGGSDRPWVCVNVYR